MTASISSQYQQKRLEYLAKQARSAVQSRTVFLGLALFFIVYTSDIKIPVPPFDGLPLWLPVAVPLLFLVSASNRSLSKALGTGLIIGAILLAHMLAAYIGYSTLPVLRSLVQIGTLVIVIPLLVSSMGAASDLFRSIEIAVKIFLIIQPLAMIFELLSGFYNHDFAYMHYFLPIWRVGGLEREPSHLSVVLSIPLTLMIGYTELWNRRFGYVFTASLIGIIVLSPASTLVWPIIAAVTVFALRSNARLALVTPPLILSMLFGPILLSEYRYSNPLIQRIWDVNRAVFMGIHNDYMNVSAIILAKGIFILRQTLENYPVGFGIDNLFYANALYGNKYSYAFGDWNARDAASILIKIGCEFGWIGLLLTIAAAVTLALRVKSHGDNTAGLMAALAFGILLSCIGRGAGYFDFGFLLVPVTAAFLGPKEKMKGQKS